MPAKIDPYWQGVFAGAIIVIAVSLDRFRNSVGRDQKDKTPSRISSNLLANISMAALPRVARAQFVNRAAERTLTRHFVSRLNIRTPTYERRAGLLSGGNQQKVMFAKWLAVQPKCLIVDESTRGVDVGTKAKIDTLFDEQRPNGTLFAPASRRNSTCEGIVQRSAWHGCAYLSMINAQR